MMKKATLTRKLKNEYGVFGHLDIHDSLLRFTTLEHPKLYIPKNGYRVVRDTTGRFQWYEVAGVPNRSEIEFHEGNLFKHTRGCILVGLYYQGDAIVHSLEALRLMRDWFGDEDWWLNIEHDFSILRVTKND